MRLWHRKHAGRSIGPLWATAGSDRLGAVEQPGATSDGWRLWQADDPRYTPEGMAAWVDELRTILVTHTWTLALLSGMAPGLDLLEVAERLQPEIGLTRSTADPVLVDVATEVRKYRDAQKRAPRLYWELGGGVPFQVVLTQLADAVCVRSGLFSESWYEQPEVVRLLRTVRDALAHGGRFDIRNTERLETHPAQVGALRVTADWKGEGIWVRLSPGDLWDVLDDLQDLLQRMAAGEP